MYNPSEAPVDTLTHVLAALRLIPTKLYRLSLIGHWGMAIDGAGSVFFHTVERGECWLRLPERDPIPLQAGDLVVITHMPAYALASTIDGPSEPIRQLVSRRDAQGVVRLATDEAPETTLMCGEFRGAVGAAYPLLTLLPALIVLRGSDGQTDPGIALPLTQISREAQQDYPGRGTVISRLMDILFIMIVRRWLDSQQGQPTGWLGALMHPQIGAVLSLIHRSPAHPWTLRALAEQVNLSRSALAAAFTARVGEAPMTYLMRWRMQRAALLLIEEPLLSIEAVAARVGYSSPYAFSRAFKRLIGLAPSAYRAIPRP